MYIEIVISASTGLCIFKTTSVETYVYYSTQLSFFLKGKNDILTN